MRKATTAVALATLVFGISAVLSTPAVRSEAVAVTECDKLAASPDARLGVGVKPSAIDAGAALVACEDAAAKHPDEPRFLGWIGRIHASAGRHAEAAAAYRKAAVAGHAISMNNLG